MDDDFDFMLSNEACEENISDTNHVLGIDWNSMMNDASAFDFLDSIVLPSQSLGFELESTCKFDCFQFIIQLAYSS